MERAWDTDITNPDIANAIGPALAISFQETADNIKRFKNQDQDQDSVQQEELTEDERREKARQEKRDRFEGKEGTSTSGKKTDLHRIRDESLALLQGQGLGYKTGDPDSAIRGLLNNINQSMKAKVGSRWC